MTGPPCDFTIPKTEVEPALPAVRHLFAEICGYQSESISVSIGFGFNPSAAIPGHIAQTSSRAVERT